MKPYNTTMGVLLYRKDKPDKEELTECVCQVLQELRGWNWKKVWWCQATGTQDRDGVNN